MPTLANFTEKPTASKSAKRSSVAQLMDLRRQCAKDAVYFRQAFRIVAQHFDALYGSLEIRIGVSTVEDTIRSGDASGEQLASIVDAMSLESASENRSRIRLVRPSKSEVLGILSQPLHDADSGQLQGAVVLAIRVASEFDADAKLRELNLLLTLVAANKSSPSATAAMDDKKFGGIQRALERAARCGSLVELAFNLVNSLGERLHCVQVAFGVEERRRIGVLAISGFDRVVSKSPGVAVMRQAMEECLDVQMPILVQQPADDAARGDHGRMLHQQWRQAVNGEAVFSVPLIVEGQVVAVVSLRRAAEQPFTEAEAKSIPAMLEPFAPAVSLFRASHRSPSERLRHWLHARFAPALGGKPVRQMLFAATMLLATTWLAFGTLPYNVSSSSVVVPAQKHHVVAPFAGKIAEVLVRAGDMVKAGQPLLRLDKRELTLERQRLEADLATTRIDVDRALSVRDATTAFVAKAQYDAIAVQLATVRERLSRAEIVAPVDGLVTQGDPLERLGQVVNLGDALLELASDGGRYVELRVSEQSVIHLRAGQTGQFVCAARPNLSIPCTIRRVRPSAEVIDGANVFVAEAELTSPPAWFRVGMEGYAKISTDRQPVWWIVFHSAVDVVRRELWL